jgi:hypothetical protein
MGKGINAKCFEQQGISLAQDKIAQNISTRAGRL